LADRLRSCLQESDELPKDFTTLFNEKLFKFDTDLIPETLDLYKQVGVKHEPLTLIPPQFETPMPALQAAVFPPTLKELPPPSLDLYDLDEQFASEKIKMAQLTNKCDDEEIEYYIKECGDILGVSAQINNPDDPKAILHYIFQEIVKYKSSNLSWSADSKQDVLSIQAFAAVNKVNGNSNLDNRSNANSNVESSRPANSAMANSDMQGNVDPDSDNSYDKL